MISIGSDRHRKKAVPQTQAVIVRLILSLGIGLALLVPGIRRIIDLGTLSLSELVMPLIGLFLIGLALFLVRDLPIARRLDKDGITTAGTVVAKWTRTDSDDDRQCFLAYRFKNDQEAYQRVGWKYYRQIEIDDVISVRYLPEDPTRSRLDGEWYR